MKLHDEIQTAYEKYKNKAYIEAEIDIRNLLAKHLREHNVLRLGALTALAINQVVTAQIRMSQACENREINAEMYNSCLLYTSPSPRDATLSRMPSSA